MSGVRRDLVVRALDYLEDGDQAEAVEILLVALEDGPDEAPACAVCGARAWPGQDERHIYSAHRADWLKRAA